MRSMVVGGWGALRARVRGGAGVALAAALAACGGDGAAGGEAATGTSTTVPGWKLEEAVTIGGAEAGENERLFGVGSVAEGPEGHFYVANFSDKRVLVFDTSGAYVRTIGRAGQGPGEFQGPRTVAAVGSDGLFVLDLQQRRVSRFRRSDGGFLGDFALRSDRLFPREMRATASGLVAVEFRAGPSIAGPARPFIAPVDTLTGEWRQDRLFPVDTVARKEVVTKQGEDRLVQVAEIPFSPRPVWGLSPEGEVIYGTGAEYAVYRGAREGQLAFRAEGQPRPVTADDRERFFADPARTAWREQMELPDTKPFFTSLQVDPDGRVWLQTRSDPQGVVWEVWELDGRKLGEVTLPGRSRLVGISGTALYVVHPDDDDVETLVRYRLVK